MQFPERMTGLFRLLAVRFPSSRRFLVPTRVRPGQAKIAMDAVAHRYENDTEALKGITLDIRPGEFVSLLGPSGCGKSTLLFTLAGVFPPSGGRITIDGKPVRGPSRDRMLMFQDPALFPWLTVAQNLTFALRSKGLPRRTADRIAWEYTHLVHLDGFEGALPHQLSAGMRMRVSLARALAMDPAVLLMDEPFGALDAQTRSQMHDLLQRVWLRTRKTVVLVTHDVHEALVLSDRVVVMAGQPGRVLRDLEVRVPRPRDPDDEVLVHLSREIRRTLRTANSSAGDSREARRTSRPATEDLNEPAPTTPEGTVAPAAPLLGGPDPLGGGL